MSEIINLEEQNDEALCKLSQLGNLDAEDVLVKRYLRLVKLISHPYYLLGGDSEDLLQEGTIGLLSAIREYQFNRQSSFFKFAETCIRNKIINVIKSANSNKNSILNQSMSLDQVCINENEYPNDPEAFILDIEQSSVLIDKMMSVLSSMEKKVFIYFMSGYSLNEIARELNRNQKSVDNCVQRIKRKLQKFI